MDSFDTSLAGRSGLKFFESIFEHFGYVAEGEQIGVDVVRGCNLRPTDAKSS